MGINHLYFSQDGKFLCATALDDEHNIAVFEWEKGTLKVSQEVLIIG